MHNFRNNHPKVYYTILILVLGTINFFILLSVGYYTGTLEISFSLYLLLSFIFSYSLSFFVFKTSYSLCVDSNEYEKYLDSLEKVNYQPSSKRIIP